MTCNTAFCWITATYWLYFFTFEHKRPKSVTSWLVKKKEKWKYTKIKYFLFEGNVCILYVQQRYLSNVLSTGKEICQHVKSSMLFNFDQSFCVAVTTCFCAVKKVVFKCFKHCSAGLLNSTILICFCFLLSLSYGFQLVSVLFNCCFTFFFCMWCCSNLICPLLRTVWLCLSHKYSHCYSFTEQLYRCHIQGRRVSEVAMVTGHLTVPLWLI